MMVVDIIRHESSRFALYKTKSARMGFSVLNPQKPIAALILAQIECEQDFIEFEVSTSGCKRIDTGEEYLWRS